MTGFLRRALAWAARAVPTMAELLRADDAERDLRVWLSLAGAVWLLRVAGGLLRAGAAKAGGLLLAELAVLVVSVYGTIYLGLLVVWLFNLLNFWMLLLLVVLLQDFRHNDPPWLARLTAATGSFALYGSYSPPARHGGHH